MSVYMHLYIALVRKRKKEPVMQNFYGNYKEIQAKCEYFTSVLYKD